MSSIDELANGGPEVEEETPREAEFIGNKPSFQLPSWLTAETGPGKIEDYLDHTLNYNNSLGLAQIIRGATGMLGSLNKAAFDIAFGFMRMKKKVNGSTKSEEFTI